jgi:hypothetical protein
MTDLLKELEDAVGAIEDYEAHERPTSDGCSDHEDAPHGFDRNGSHNADRYVCDCEGWEPDAAENATVSRKAIAFLRTHHAKIKKEVADARRYRWLRDHSLGQWEYPICVSQSRTELGMRYVGPLTESSLDNAIDAAIDAQHNSAREG